MFRRKFRLAGDRPSAPVDAIPRRAYSYEENPATDLGLTAQKYQAAISNRIGPDIRAQDPGFSDTFPLTRPSIREKNQRLQENTVAVKARPVEASRLAGAASDDPVIFSVPPEGVTPPQIDLPPQQYGGKLGAEITQDRWERNRYERGQARLAGAISEHSIDPMEVQSRSTSLPPSAPSPPPAQPPGNALNTPEQPVVSGVNTGSAGSSPAVAPPPRMSSEQRLAGDAAAHQRFGVGRARPATPADLSGSDPLEPDLWRAQQLGGDGYQHQIPGFTQSNPPQRPPQPPRSTTARQAEYFQPSIPGTQLVTDESPLHRQVVQGLREGWGYAHDKPGFARSAIWSRAPRSAYEELPPIARAGFAAGRIAGDVVGEGSRSLLWRIHPEDAVGTKVGENLAGLGLSRSTVATGAKLATVGMGLAAGNISLSNLEEGGRPEGFSAIDPTTEDARLSNNNLGEVFNRTVLGRTGRLLPWEEFNKEMPNVSYQQYADYQNYLKDQGPLFGVIKGTMNGIDGPEVRVAGYRLTPEALLAPLAIVGGARYLARRGLIK